MKNPMRSIAFYLTLSVLCAHLSYAQSPWQSQVVYYDGEGKLVYQADGEGNRIPDFSYAGYKNGEAEIPNVPTVKSISPVPGDNTLHIQNAIDSVGAMPLDPNGIRGALLLTAGVYQVYGTLRINHDGVVLRGVGNGADSTRNTIIFAAGNTPHQRTVIVAGGGSSTRWSDEVEGTRTNITSGKVFVGSRSFAVENSSLFAPGDNIIVFHPVTEEWIAAVGGGGTAADRDWLVSDGINIVFNRYVKGIAGDTITIDAPVFNTLDTTLSQSYVYTYARTGLKTNIGIEHLRVDIEAAGVPTDPNGNENHAWQAIDLFQIEDAWVRNCTMLHFGQSGIRFSTASRITVESCNALDPVSIITGERRYNFNLYHASQLVLVKNCLSTYSRHDFISNGTSTTSGCVFFNNQSQGAYASSEGHRFWSQGLLFDNVTFTSPNTTILLGLYSRGDYGTSHGWAAAHSVAWKCTVPGGNRIIIQKPPTAQNYAIGSFGGTVTGLKSEGAPFDYPQGYIEGTNTGGLTPSSLYEAQLVERIGPGQPPASPTNLTATVMSSRRIDLTWADNSSNETTFRIERSTDAGSTWSHLISVGISVVSYSDTGLASAASYSYRVRAENGVGNSEFSNTSTATTAQGLPIAAPTNLGATAKSVNRIDIVWEDNSDNEDHFRIERSEDGDSWFLLTNVGINTTQYPNLGLPEATTFHYRVRAENVHGSSDYSNTDSASTHFVEASSNLALNKPVKFSSEQTEVDNENQAWKAVDGSTATRWSSARDSLWPQWIEVDLGSAMTINKTEVACFSDRAYQFSVDVKTDSNGAAIQVVDRSANTTPGTVASPIIDVFDSVSARYVRITVTGAYGYAGPWTSILEFRVFNSSGPVAVERNTAIPVDFDLAQNYPNPFNPSTRIIYQIPRTSLVNLAIFNMIGQEVIKLVDGHQQAGDYEVEWEGVDFGGRNVNSGVYFARMHAGDFVKVLKLLLIK